MKIVIGRCGKCGRILEESKGPALIRDTICWKCLSTGIIKIGKRLIGSTKVLLNDLVETFS